MFSYSRLYNSAASNACGPQLIHPILMSILLEHHKQLEILRKSVADKYFIIQRGDFSCSFRCCTSIKTSDLSGSLSWVLTLYIQFSRLFALLYRSRNLFFDILIPSLPDKYTVVYSLKIFLLRYGIRTEGQWTGWDLNPRPFACEANIRTPELPALKTLISNPDIKCHNAFQSYHCRNDNFM